MKPTLAGSIVPTIAMALALPAQGQPGFPYAVNLHWGSPPTSAFACTPGSDLPDPANGCGIIQTDLLSFPPTAGTFQHLWVVVSGVDADPALDGIGSIRFGIEWPAGSVASPLWELCTGGDTATTHGVWPDGSLLGGSAASFSWAGDCYNVTANPDGATKIGFITFIAGPFSAGTFRIIEDPSLASDPSWNTPAAIASTCPPVQTVRICKQLLGTATTGPGGVNTCGFICNVPIERASWAGIKAAFGDAGRE